MSIQNTINNTSDVLITSSLKQSLYSLISTIPHPFWWAVECSVNSLAPKADFMFALRHNAEETRAINNWLEQINHSSEPNPYLILKDLLKKWGNKDHFYHGMIDYLWLEYDMNIENEIHSPFLFTVFNSFVLDQNLHTTLVSQIVEECSAGLEAITTKRLNNILNSLDNNVSLYAIGYTDQRQLGSVRIVLKSEDINHFMPFLNKAGYSQENTSLSESKQFEIFADSYLLHMDLGHNTNIVKFGLELVFDSPNQNEKLTDCLDYLMKLNLCSSEKKKAIESWISPPIIERKTVRYVSYLKLVFKSSQITDVKVYLFGRDYGT